MGANTQVAIVAAEDAGTSFWYTPMRDRGTRSRHGPNPACLVAPTRTATRSTQGATARGPGRTNCWTADS